MADDRFEQAVDIIARHVIARAVGQRPPLRSFREVSVEDQKAIWVRINELAPFEARESVLAAYDYLTGRAEGIES